MKCAVHPDAEAIGYCRNCGKPLCSTARGLFVTSTIAKIVWQER